MQTYMTVVGGFVVIAVSSAVTAFAMFIVVTILNGTTLWLARLKRDRFLCILRSFASNYHSIRISESLYKICDILEKGWGKEHLETMLEQVRSLDDNEQDSLCELCQEEFDINSGPHSLCEGSRCNEARELWEEK